MEETEDLRTARALRRAMMGDEYVDAQVAGIDGCYELEKPAATA